MLFYHGIFPVLTFLLYLAATSECSTTISNTSSKIESKTETSRKFWATDKESSSKASENMIGTSPRLPEKGDSGNSKYIDESQSKHEKSELLEGDSIKEIEVDEHGNHSSSEHHGIHVASWQFDYVRTPLVYTTVVIVAGLCKMGFHHAHYLSSIFPESCVLIMLGIVVGTIVHFTHSREMLPQFTPKAFFLFLLPPIVLESAYSLHDRAFFSNLGTIMLYAVVGTLINCFTIGISLYGLTESGLLEGVHLHLIECFVFSALISAVDPVAVLAIFQEVGVNKNLYFLVFGESLLNDAVTIVLYMMMVAFSKAEFITAEQVALGIAAFLCVSIGGLAIGIIMGVFTALLTKHTEEVRVVEPLAMLGMAYLSYLLAEMVHFSGIISIIGCGIMQAHYASKNISQKSNTTVKYFTKMISAVSDTVIFLFLGMVLVDDQHVWHTGFVLWSAGFCFIYRFMGVFFLTYLANRWERTRRINTEEQFIMAYGGLRGAVAFSLVIMLDDIENKNLFITATLFIVLFTVFIQGATIKPLVVLLNIRTHTAKPSSMFTEVNKKLVDHVMAGVEVITGDHGGHHWKQLLFHYNSKYLKRWLMCNYKESNLSRVYTQMMLEDHYAHLYGPAAVIEDKKPLLLHKVSMEEDEELLDGLKTIGDEEDADAADQFKGRDYDENAQETKPLQERPRSSSIISMGGRPQLMKRQTTLAVFRKHEDAGDPSRLLHKALHDNRYNKLHHKYNPNLVGEEDQDLDMHLRLRRMRAKRLTLLAMHPKPSAVPTPAPAVVTTIASTVASTTTTPATTPARRSSTDISSSAAVINAASFFLERAAQRRNVMRKRKESAQNGPSSGDVSSGGTSTNKENTKSENDTAVVHKPKVRMADDDKLETIIIDKQSERYESKDNKSSETKV